MLLATTKETMRNLLKEGTHMAAEHQRLMDAWRELWGQYKAIIDAFDGMIYICSSSFEIEFVNRHLAEMLGCSPLGQKCYKALYNLDHPCPRCSKEKVLREKLRQKSFNPQIDRPIISCHPLSKARPMMVTIQHLPVDCPTQISSWIKKP
jgi:PAS domain-containing protein